MEYNNFNYNNCYRKKSKEEQFYGGSRSRSQQNNRPFNGRQQQSALSLEKQFCAAVGGVSWEKVLDTQKYMHQDEKVFHWKDSAVQEAFWNAKKRFLAEAYGHPCDIKLPNPDDFIDNIDWDSNVDQELLIDLDKKDYEIPCETQKDSGVVVGIPAIPEQFALTPMGWGDAESQEENKPIGVNNADNKWSNNGWNDDYVYPTHDIDLYGAYRNSGYGGHKNKWSKHGGYNKKRGKGWNNGGWNSSEENFSGFRQNGNSYAYAYNNSNRSYNRRNFSSDIQWRPKPISSKQW